MAKKKTTKSKDARLANIMKVAQTAHTRSVGVGGRVWDPYLSHVRALPLPGLGLMTMLGFTGLRDSCTVLIYGAPGSHKSSFGIEVINWGYKYGVAGGIIDCENKAAVDIALGTLTETTLWTPGQMVMSTATSVEQAQDELTNLVKFCHEINDGLDRDYHIPFIGLVDPLAGVPAEETVKVIDKQGHGDKGHGGRTEANIWTSYLKYHEAQILNLPFISVFVNHVKQRQKKLGNVAVTENYNPGGVSQNYATTIAFECKAGKAFRSEAHGGKSYNEVWIKCTKNSRGPTGGSTCVRKYWRPMKDGTTKFWWDWERNTAETLAAYKSNHPVHQVCAVTKHTNDKYSCKTLGLKDVSPTEIGAAIHADSELMDNIIKALELRKLTEFMPLSDEDLAQMNELAHKEHMKYLKEAGVDPTLEAPISEDDSEPVVEETEEADDTDDGVLDALDDLVNLDG